MIRTRLRSRSSLVIAMALATLAGSTLVSPTPAHADDCLLDTNNDGDADATTDTDGGANSGGIDGQLACGVNAFATGIGSTAIGNTATASAFNSTAVGQGSDATSSDTTALGVDANATSASAIAIGSHSNATNVGAIAIGADGNDVLNNGALATGLGSTAIGVDAVASADSTTALGGLALGIRNVRDSLGEFIERQRAQFYCRRIGITRKWRLLYRLRFLFHCASNRRDGRRIRFFGRSGRCGVRLSH